MNCSHQLLNSWAHSELYSKQKDGDTVDNLSLTYTKSKEKDKKNMFRLHNNNPTQFNTEKNTHHH